MMTIFSRLRTWPKMKTLSKKGKSRIQRMRNPKEKKNGKTRKISKITNFFLFICVKGSLRMPEFVCSEKIHRKRKDTICGMTFNSREDFDEHMKKVHGYRG